MYCPQCGKEQPDEVSFCCQCGAAVRGGPQASKKLTLDANNKKIAGVCAGFAKYLDMDVTLVRLIWVMLALAGGWGLIGYVIAWLIMPSEKAEEKSTAAENRPVTAT
jgi:phage shock protein C